MPPKRRTKTVVVRGPAPVRKRQKPLKLTDSQKIKKLDEIKEIKKDLNMGHEKREKFFSSQEKKFEQLQKLKDQLGV